MESAVGDTEEGAGDRSRDAVAFIYNSAVAVPAISAAWELGILDALSASGSLDIDEFAAAHRLDRTATHGLFRALAAVDIVERAGTTAVPAANFAEVCRNRSFFHWLARGNADLLRTTAHVLREENRTGAFYQRDSAAISVACREISALTYDPWFRQALDDLDFTPRAVADLGCGSGERVLQLLRRFPGARGVGIDIARPAVEMTRSEAERAGLADRLSVVEADARALRPRPELADVELLTCFMMGHDFWPRDSCVRHLRNLREVFPAVRRFLIGDATRTDPKADRELPVFTLGFEFAHDLMGTYIPTASDWSSVFPEAGWRLVKTHSIDVAVGEVIFELERL
ncbi:class I SAM-dependent methyltransferase [Allostreptomyces psammosilenae]|uniref:SAM-dependent methyltransferase n=1 Tax=Allostreptomyces psammosilenae TaxID=1892865 RepID=A0A852ZV75_9ACTN|nr:class I SAM-dependent methyltransferase [Allostreptomyces psammosilenae]NYI04684.1 SAM-dependent methyltransferase [Allostreptomyces psammosilenae]